LLSASVALAFPTFPRYRRIFHVPDTFEVCNACNTSGSHFATRWDVVNI
jgi:hypothetical protein